MINISNLTAGYGKQPVIKNISLHIEKGRITTIIGPNGSGKSTLLKCIARQIKRTGGDISVSGQPIDTYSPKEFAKRISYLRQTRDVPMISAESLVLHGRFPYMGFPRKLDGHDKSIAKNAMLRVGVWDIRDKELPELSGGECQKVYLAMTLAQGAEALLLDEPTTYLDIKYQLQLLRLLCELKADGKTIVTVLHDINSALQICDNICVINHGEVAFFGAPGELVRSGIIAEVFGVKVTPVQTTGQAGDELPYLICSTTARSTSSGSAPS